MTLKQPADEREEFELVVKNQNRFHCEPPFEFVLHFEAFLF
jgi:hypothetical protein